MPINATLFCSIKINNVWVCRFNPINPHHWMPCWFLWFVPSNQITASANGVLTELPFYDAPRRTQLTKVSMPITTILFRGIKFLCSKKTLCIISVTNYRFHFPQSHLNKISFAVSLQQPFGFPSTKHDQQSRPQSGHLP